VLGWTLFKSHLIAFPFLLYLYYIVTKAQDACVGAYGPRPTDGSTGRRPTDNVRFSAGNTQGSTLDDNVIEGDFCGVDITNPGIWWSIEGTGKRMRATSCHPRTRVKVKLSVFTGTCSALRCVGGGQEADFGCETSANTQSAGWESVSTAYDFDTFEGQFYYILVQQTSNVGGVVWMGFSPATEPSNNVCHDAVGPVPRDGLTTVNGDSLQANMDYPQPGLCGTNQGEYPGVWYQIFGTGGRVTLEACSEFNTGGFEFSVYNGFRCEDNSLSCVTSQTGNTQYAMKSDPGKCTFGNMVGTDGESFIVGPMTTFSFDTVDRDRYYILVNFEAGSTLIPTAPFRFWVDDGENGNAGSGGTTGISLSAGGDTVDDGNGNGDGNGDGNNGDQGGGDGSGAERMLGMGFSAVVALSFPAVMMLAL
jgi:hypothetical protein